MKRILFFLFVVVNFAWSIPKPMESITNYNVMMLHGALGSDKGFKEKALFPQMVVDKFKMT